MKTIRVGLIGTGYMGKAHAIALRSVPAVFELSAKVECEMLAEVNEQLAQDKAKELGFNRATGDWLTLVNDENIDVVGACLGVRGARIRNVNDELRNEKIDIIAWSGSLEELVVNALKPAKDIMVEHVFPDEENNSVFVLVPEDQKPLAIGMGGRNVRLASEIVGWGIDLKTPTEYEQELLAEGNIEELPEEGDAEEGITEKGLPEEA